MAKKRGSYLGGSTVIGPRSGWFTFKGKKPEEKIGRKIKILKEKRLFVEKQTKLDY